MFQCYKLTIIISLLSSNLSNLSSSSISNETLSNLSSSSVFKLNNYQKWAVNFFLN